MTDPIIYSSSVLNIGGDDNYAAESDAFDGTPVKVEPSGGQLAQGARPHKQLAAQHVNWIWRQFALYMGQLRLDQAEDSARLTDLLDNGFPNPDYPKLKDGREFTEWQPFIFTNAQFGTGWGDGFDYTYGTHYGTSKSTTTAANPAYFKIHRLRAGATLRRAIFYFRMATTHSGVPANMPSFEVFKHHVTDGSATDAATLRSAGPVVAATPADVGECNDGGMHSVTAVFDQNNDIGGIDSTWFAKIVPEHGANSVANSIYVGMDLVWVANDIRP